MVDLSIPLLIDKKDNFISYNYNETEQKVIQDTIKNNNIDSLINWYNEFPSTNSMNSIKQTGNQLYTAMEKSAYENQNVQKRENGTTHMLIILTIQFCILLTVLKKELHMTRLSKKTQKKH